MVAAPALLASTLPADAAPFPPPSASARPSQPLWRFALIGLGPLGVMGLIALGTAIVRWAGA